MQVEKGSRFLTAKLKHQSALKQPELLAEKPSLFSSSDLELQESLVEKPSLVDPLFIAEPLETRVVEPNLISPTYQEQLISKPENELKPTIAIKFKSRGLWQEIKARKNVRKSGTRMPKSKALDTIETPTTPWRNSEGKEFKPIMEMFPIFFCNKCNKPLKKPDDRWSNTEEKFPVNFAHNENRLWKTQGKNALETFPKIDEKLPAYFDHRERNVANKPQASAKTRKISSSTAIYPRYPGHLETEAMIMPFQEFPVSLLETSDLPWFPADEKEMMSSNLQRKMENVETSQ